MLAKPFRSPLLCRRFAKATHKEGTCTTPKLASRLPEIKQRGPRLVRNLLPWKDRGRFLDVDLIARLLNLVAEYLGGDISLGSEVV